MKITKMIVVWATLLAIVIVGVVLPTPQAAEAQLDTTTMVGLPDADPNSGRFINVTRGMNSLGGVPGTGQVLNISLEIPATRTQFVLAIFDGDMGGLWDRWGSPKPPEGGGQAEPFDDVQFELYRDPNMTGNSNSTDRLASWSGEIMPDDDWFTATVLQDPGAYNATRGAYYYHLVCKWVITNDYANEQNNFKIAVQGRPFLRAGTTIGFEGFTWKYNQNYAQDPTTLPRTTGYDGTFSFYFNFNLPGITEINLYDGDADQANDADDLNSPSEACRGDLYTWPDYPSPLYSAWLNAAENPGCNFPPFPTSPCTLAEGANPGVPPDDTFLPPGNNVIVTPPVYYTISAPGSAWTLTNANPSGNQEWELYRITTGNGSDADAVVPSLPIGVYTWRWIGLDALNILFIVTDYDIATQPGTGSSGYWKTHPQAWPVDSITIGGVTYTKDQAIVIMKTTKANDKTYDMFNALVCAKLNIILGNESSCIANTVAAADNWMVQYPLGSGVKANSAAWKSGTPLFLKLEEYNNGLLCAPHIG
nr:hypothetical protein [Chloroflexota bacterium]